MKQQRIPWAFKKIFNGTMAIFLASISYAAILQCTEVSAANNLVILFESGRGTDELDVRRTPFYESTVAFTPSIDMNVYAIKPTVHLCNGTCIYEVEVFDMKNELIGYGNEDEARATLFDGTLQHPVVMIANKTYRISMRIESNKEVGISTTGRTRRWMRWKNGTFETLSAGWLHPTKERGAIAFTIIGKQGTQEMMKMRRQRRIGN